MHAITNIQTDYLVKSSKIKHADRLKYQYFPYFSTLADSTVPAGMYYLTILLARFEIRDLTDAQSLSYFLLSLSQATYQVRGSVCTKLSKNLDDLLKRRNIDSAFHMLFNRFDDSHFLPEAYCLYLRNVDFLSSLIISEIHNSLSRPTFFI